MFTAAWAEDVAPGSTTSPAAGATDVPPAPVDAPRRIGVGYKAGNGLGYLGADVNVSPFPHVDVDLQVNWFSEKYGASGFGAAPTVRLVWDRAGRSTPYLSLGVTYFRLTFDNGVRGSGDGALANLGYEWKWASGFGVLVGGGLLYLRKVSAADPGLVIIGAEGFHPNVELGLRYRFL